MEDFRVKLDPGYMPAPSPAGALSFGAEAALNLDAGTDGEDVYVARARP